MLLGRPKKTYLGSPEKLEPTLGCRLPLPKSFSLSKAVLKSMLNLFSFSFFFLNEPQHLLSAHNKEKVDLAFFIFKTVPKGSKCDDFTISNFFKKSKSTVVHTLKADT